MFLSARRTLVVAARDADMLPLRVGCILLGSCVAGTVTREATGPRAAFSPPASAAPTASGIRDRPSRRRCGVRVLLLLDRSLAYGKYKSYTLSTLPTLRVTSRRGSAPHAPILGFRARPRPRPQLGLGLAFCTGCIVSLYHPAVLSVSLSLSAIGARCMGRRRARSREYADDRGVNVQMIGVRRRGGTSGGSGRHSNCRRGDEGAAAARTQCGLNGDSMGPAHLRLRRLATALAKHSGTALARAVRHRSAARRARPAMLIRLG